MEWSERVARRALRAGPGTIARKAKGLGAIEFRYFEGGEAFLRYPVPLKVYGVFA